MEQYIQPFINVCERVFRNFCNMDIKAGRVFFMERLNDGSCWDVSGVIGLSGDAHGAVAISMKDFTAFNLTSFLTGKKHDAFDTDVIDAVGEVINIIVGNIKKEFEESMKTTISIPSIIKGRGHSIVWPSNKVRIICIPFSDASDNEICLSVAVDTSK